MPVLIDTKLEMLNGVRTEFPSRMTKDAVLKCQTTEVM